MPFISSVMMISSLNTDSRQYTISFTAVRKKACPIKALKRILQCPSAKGTMGIGSLLYIACFYLSVIGDPT